MNTQQTIISVIVALVIVIGGVYFLGSNSIPSLNPMNGSGTETNKDKGLASYTNAEFEIKFRFPIGLYLKERSAGTPERPQLSLLLVSNNQENRDLLDGKTTEPREGPTGITVDAYQNPQKLSAADWVQSDANWTVATSGVTPVEAGSHEGVSFTWSGLYEGRTVVLTEGDKAYVFTVTWLTPEDQILKDFDVILNSLLLGEATN